jgi:hypothetical protein
LRLAHPSLGGWWLSRFGCRCDVFCIKNWMLGRLRRFSGVFRLVPRNAAVGAPCAGLVPPSLGSWPPGAFATKMGRARFPARWGLGSGIPGADGEQRPPRPVGLGMLGPWRFRGACGRWMDDCRGSGSFVPGVGFGSASVFFLWIGALLGARLGSRSSSGHGRPGRHEERWLAGWVAGWLAGWLRLARLLGRATASEVMCRLRARNWVAPFRSSGGRGRRLRDTRASHAEPCRTRATRCKAGRGWWGAAVWCCVFGKMGCCWGPPVHFHLRRPPPPRPERTTSPTKKWGLPAVIGPLAGPTRSAHPLCCRKLPRILAGKSENDDLGRGGGNDEMEMLVGWPGGRHWSRRAARDREPGMGPTDARLHLQPTSVPTIRAAWPEGNGRFPRRMDERLEEGGVGMRARRHAKNSRQATASKP